MDSKDLEQLKKNYEFFMENLKELSEKYKGKFLLLKDEAVVEAFASEIEAYKAGVERFGLGTFIIQECKSNDKSSYIQTFRSRVKF